MEIRNDAQGNTVMVLRGDDPGNRYLEVVIPQTRGKLWRVTIRSPQGDNRGSVNVSEADALSMAGEIMGQRPGATPWEMAPARWGNAVEMAAAYLTSVSIPVLETNWCVDKGGISVIAVDGMTLVAVYIRLGDATGRFRSPLDAISETTYVAIRDLALIWMAQHQDRVFDEVRIDEIGVLPQANGYVIEHVRNVTP